MKLITLLSVLLLSACTGGGGTDFTPTSGNNLGAIAASGAPLPNVPFTITRLDGTILVTGTVATDAYLQATVSASDAPFVVKVTDTGVTPNVDYENLVLPSDFDTGSGLVNLNVTPISTIVTKVVKGQLGNLSKASATDLIVQRSAAADAVKSALQPLLDAAGVQVASGLDLIKKVFIPVSDPLDKVLDTIQVDCGTTTNTCTITPSSAKAASTTSALTINTTTVAAANTSAATVKMSLTNVKTDMMASAPVVVVFGSGGSWGTANDSWAGYTGKFTIYNFTDQAINGGSTLYFESSKLKQNGFWDVSANVANSKFLLTLPSWGNLAPKTSASKAPSSYTFGFNGSGVPSAVTDISACNINGKKCLVLIDDGTLNTESGASSEIKVRSWVNFLSTLPKTVSNETTAENIKTLPAPTSSSTSEVVQSAQKESSNVSTGSAGQGQIALVSTSSWVGGFNGELQLTNSSGTSWKSWTVSFTKPSSITALGGWGNYKLQTSGSNVTFSNESWNGNLDAGKLIKLGFGGSGTLDEKTVSPSDCTITYVKLNNDTVNSVCSAVATSVRSSNQPTGGNTGSSSSAPSPATVAPPTAASAPQNNSANSSAPKVSSTSDSSSGGAEPSTVAGSVKAIQGANKRVFVGYYPSWSDNWFSAYSWDNVTKLTDDQILAASKMARIPGTYTHVVAAFAQPNFTWTSANMKTNAWTGTGLNFNAGPKDIAAAIKVLHDRNIKVLVAVGGATYNNWDALAAEDVSTNGVITNALAQMLIDVGFDGLDIDYEVEGITTKNYTGAVNAMRKAVDIAKVKTGKDMVLALAGWSTGADPEGTYWGGKSGGERLVFSQTGMAAKIDMVSIMSYDARYEYYDGVKAWEYYRDLFPSTTIVNIGLETAPEGWAGGMLVVNDADDLCTGSRILKDQTRVDVNKPYSVHRYASAVMNPRHNSNPRDGAMLWQILKTANASCGTAIVASPGTIASKIQSLYGLSADSRSAWK